MYATIKPDAFTDTLLLQDPTNAVELIKDKRVNIRPWEELKKEYDPKLHPVMDTAVYPDVVSEDGIERVSRVPFDYQRLATKRLSEMITGIPVKRTYSTDGEQQEQVRETLELIYQKNRIDAVNVERVNLLFAGCEVFTLWYALPVENDLYGTHSLIKVRCRNYSPVLGNTLYPVFDETGDMVAMGIETAVKKGRKGEKGTIHTLDVYTATHHLAYQNDGGRGVWQLVTKETHNIGKIPGVYCYRPTPAWEDTSNLVYEMEWALSRNGNYLRRNSKPVFYIETEEGIDYGQEKDERQEFRTIFQIPKGASLGYVTWNQATDTLKLYIDELRKLFFTTLQIPDWSYEDMKNSAMSGEARKQLFIDAHLKVKDESGRLLEFFDRETNVLKAFAEIILGADYKKDIEAVTVETEITPYILNDEAQTIRTLIEANGNKPLISQRESIELLGWSNNTSDTLREINEENNLQDLFK